MLKKPITFENLDGDEITEVFYFHLSQAELVKMQISHGGDLQTYVARILKEQNAEAIMAMFDEIILSTVGRRSSDGKRFEKEDGQIAKEFKETDAYSVLFTELLSNEGKNFQEFFTGVIPNKMQDKMKENLQTQTQARLGEAAEKIQKSDETPKAPAFDLSKVQEDHEDPRWMKEGREPTREEMLKMSPAEFAQFAKTR